MKGERMYGEMKRHFMARPISRRDELERALRLVHDSYVRKGYMEPDPSGMRISIWYALPTTRTFVGMVGEEIASTVTLFVDSELGLPLDEVFKDRLDTLRDSGRKIGEVGMLADRRDHLERTLYALLRMMKHVFWAARSIPLDDLVVAVSPHHGDFYRKMLCFESLADPRPHGAVQGAEAELLRINLADLSPSQARNSKMRSLFFSPIPPNEEVDEPYAMTREDLQYFSGRAEQLAKMHPDALEIVEKVHRDSATSSQEGADVMGDRQ